MYAIIQTGGKQYRVEKGDKLQVQKLEHPSGEEFVIPEVLLVSGEEGGQAKIGQPFVQDSKVVAMVVRHLRGPKIIVFKMRSKKGSRKKQGHRQDLTEIQVKEIVA